ncbi:MAG: queuosine salvage family protein [Syntrophobacteraceae bacterium]
MRKLPVLGSIEPVVETFERVRLHPEAVDDALARWGHVLRDLPPWDRSLHFFDGTAETVRWIFVLDVLNHCFWPDPGQPTWSVTYRGESHSGYRGLAACLKRAMEASAPLTHAAFLETVSPAALSQIFAGEGQVPLFDERLANLREAGRELRDHWQGDIVHLLEAAGGSAVRTAQLVVDSFPSFRDEAVYDGHRLYFWKRAQIFASDVHHAFSGQDWGAFDDIDQLTAFADYKLPQVLRTLGILSYREDLEECVDGLVYLDPGGAEEVEIRAMTIHAVEIIRSRLEASGSRTSSARIDHWLWQLGQIEPFRKKPYHRCRTIYY